jgi:hypothetical protein
VSWSLRFAEPIVLADGGKLAPLVILKQDCIRASLTWEVEIQDGLHCPSRTRALPINALSPARFMMLYYNETGAGLTSRLKRSCAPTATSARSIPADWRSDQKA